MPTATTKFSKDYLAANEYLARAVESDGTDALAKLATARRLAISCENSAYEYSVSEQIMANSLISLIKIIEITIR